MVYTAPASAVANDLAQAAWANLNIIENIKALKDPSVGTLTVSGFTTTSLSYVDMDATAQLSLTTYGGHLLFVFYAYVSVAGGAGPFWTPRLLIDGVAVSAVVIKEEQQGAILYVFGTDTRPTVGTHVIKPQWKVSYSGSTATLGALQMRVMEVG